MRMLRVGDKFRHKGGSSVIFEVLRVTPCAAYVRSTATEHRVISDVEGNVQAEFDARPKGNLISSMSDVEIVEEGPAIGFVRLEE